MKDQPQFLPGQVSPLVLFAAMAPEVPCNFRFIYTEPVPREPVKPDFTAEQKRQYEDCLHDAIGAEDVTDPAVSGYIIAMNQYWESRESYDFHQSQERQRCWRWHYAREMVKAGPPELTQPQSMSTSYSAANAADMLGSKGALAIAEERLRQKSQERYTAERDDQYTQSQLAMAGAWYAIPPSESEACGALWPRDWDLPKDSHGDNLTPAGRKRELAKAGALIAAEWDRIDRLELKL